LRTDKRQAARTSGATAVIDELESMVLIVYRTTLMGRRS